MFKLKCYFEDLTAAGIYKIISWLSKDSAGKLVFDDRPNVYYEVRPTAQFSPTTYTCRHDWMNQVVYSGTFTAEFTAYFPFGYMTRTSYDDADECGESNYSGILPSSMMPEVPGAQALTKERTSFLIYNPGTQPCCLNFEIKTDNLPNGSTIRNITNGTKYVFTGTGNNPGSITVKVDSDTGRTYRQGASLVWIDANELHDEGYVTLEPYGVLYQNVAATSVSGSTKIKLSGMDATSDLVGLHIWFGGEWLKISNVLATGELVVLKTFTSSTTEYATITKMNEIELYGNGAQYRALKFSVDYKPIVL